MKIAAKQLSTLVIYRTLVLQHSECAMFESRMTTSGRTTIPRRIRDELNLKPGDKMYWSLNEGRVIVRAKNRSIKELAGILHRPGQRPVSLEEMDEAIAEEVGESALAGNKSRP